MLRRQRKMYLAIVELRSVSRFPGVKPGQETCFANDVNLHFEGPGGKEMVKVGTIPCYYRPNQPERYRVSIYLDGIRKLARAAERRWINPETGTDVQTLVCEAIENEIRRVNQSIEEWEKLSPDEQKESMNRMLEMHRRFRG